MNSEPIEINFKENSNGKSYFDIIKISDIFNNKKTELNLFENHKISFYSLLLILEGNGFHTINYKEYSYSKGSIFTLNKNTIHKFSKNKSQGYLILFTEDFIASYLGKIETTKTLQLFNEFLFNPKIELDQVVFNEFRNLIKQIENEFFVIKDTLSFSLIRSLIHTIIIKIYRIKIKTETSLNNSKYLTQFLKFQNLVSEQCFQDKTVTFYSKQLAITTKTLNNITKSILNKSAKAFIDEIYIVQCKRLLINSELSIKETAYKIGFENDTNFYNYFKKQTSLTPKEFKDKHK